MKVKSIALAIGLFLSCIQVNAQPDEQQLKALKAMLFNELTKVRSERKADSIIRATYSEERTGTGTGTFSSDILVVQSYFTSKRKINQFEKTLNKWVCSPYEETDGGNPELAYVIDGKNDETKIFTLTYDNTDKKGKEDNIRVEFGLDSTIRTISFRIIEDDINVDQIGNYIQKMKSIGYEFDIASTRIGQSYTDYPVVTYAKNTKNKIRVRFLQSSVGTLVTVMKQSAVRRIK